MAKKPRIAKKGRRALNKDQKKEVAKIAKRVTEKDAEHKQYAVATTGGNGTSFFAGTAGATFVDLTAIGRGTGDSERVGDEITIQAIRVRMAFQNNLGASSNIATVVRVLIFQYKNADNNPQLTEMLLASAANDGTVSGALSSRNIDYMGIYNVLVDKTFILQGSNNQAVTGAGLPDKYSKYIDIKVPKKYMKRKIQFEGNTVNTTNGIWITVTSDRATNTNNPFYKFDAHVIYTDS